MACLLNAQAEIQLGDTVYRYCSKGVGYTMESNAEALQNLDSLLNLNPGVEKSLNPVDLGEGITFVPILRLCSLNFRAAGVACLEQISQVEEGAMRAS